MIDADLPLEDIVKEYERSEQSILSKKPILIENTNQQVLYTTPTKRQRTNWCSILKLILFFEIEFHFSSIYIL